MLTLRNIVFLLLSCVIVSPLFATESFEGKTVESISIQIETKNIHNYNEEREILVELHTKVGDPFSQVLFDQDLKTLSEQYDRVEPVLKLKNSGLSITLKLWEKPTIRQIKWEGNEFIPTKKLQKKLGIKPNTVFNRSQFNEAFAKVKEYYVKKGYFEAELDYRVEPLIDYNEVDIFIHVNEGHSGKIHKIVFHGFTKEEQRQLLDMINSKKYHFLTSWIYQSGIYHDEVIEYDKMIVLNFLQNLGYADAQVDISAHENEQGKLIIEISAVKGALFHFGEISFSGNELYSNAEIENVITIHKGDRYSHEQIIQTKDAIENLYGKKGYIEATVHYMLSLDENQPIYNVHFNIMEDHQYRVGIIRVVGNENTNSKVILRESLLVPGEVFDNRKLEYTKRRLEAMGYFKSVNVYAIRGSDDKTLGENYRDVIVEVEETTTGSLSAFFGYSTNDSFSGGISLSENNFNYEGLTRFWKDGMSSLRGGGEFFQLKIVPGILEQNYSIVWMTPYYRDTLWRVGFDLSYERSRLQSKHYSTRTVAFNQYSSYPLSPYWNCGWNFRLSNTIVHMNEKAAINETVQTQSQNSGFIAGFALNAGFNSIDNAFKPHRGFRSIIEFGINGIRRHSGEPRAYPFLKGAYINTLYYPVWRKGTLKTRLDLKAIAPLMDGTPDLIPLSERFFLGGDNSVRGYSPFKIGPKFEKEENGIKEKTREPTGGVSSLLTSIEYNQEIFRMLDGFIFFDGGSISNKTLNLHQFNMSYGFGIRLDVGNRIPIMLGWGIPINPDRKKDVKNFFFSMAGQF